MILKAVFFDLDGTLLDTATDLGRALNKLLAEYGKPEIPLAKLRNVVSDGANALLKAGFNAHPQDANFPELRQSLLNYYLDDLARHTIPFDGIEELISKLNSHNIQWGIVTNKPWTYAEPLMTHFKFASAPSALICPEHVKSKKPDPESLILACNKAQCLPEEAIYIGDHARDIECGIRANIPTIAVAYGYIPVKNDHLNWGATHTVEHAQEIWPILATYIDTPSINASV